MGEISELREAIEELIEQIDLGELEASGQLAEFLISFRKRAAELPTSFWEKLRQMPLEQIGGMASSSLLRRLLDQFSPAFFEQFNHLLSSESSKTRSSGWIPSWQVDSEVRALNQGWLEKSVAAARSVFKEEEVERFLDPSVPMDEIWTRCKTLGGGAFGTTVLWDAGDGRSFAVKEMKANSGNGVCDFEVGLRLSHPNIVEINNFVQKRDVDGRMRRYLVMEYIDGCTLRTSDLSYEQQLKVGREMVDSARHMLAAGILPTDLHNNNMMVTKSGEWKWIDLGLYQPIEAAHRYDLAYFYHQLSHAFDRVFGSRSQPQTWQGETLVEIRNRFGSLEGQHLAMDLRGLRVLDDFCLEVGGWLDHQIGSVAIAA